MRKDSNSRINEDPLPHSLSFNIKETKQTTHTVSPGKARGPKIEEKGIYERSLSRLQDRALKIKKIEQAMLKECTFSPVINASNARGKDCKAEVWRRLYPDKQVIPQKSKKVDSLIEKKNKCRTPMSVDTNSTGSSRIEKLYQDGVQKSMSRAARTDKEESIIRQQRFEELNLRSCTFKPTMRWTVKTLSPKKKLSPLRPQDNKFLALEPTPEVLSVPNAQEEAFGHTMETEQARTSPLQIRKRAFRSPLTFAVDSKIEIVAVSPLREPSFSDDTSQSFSVSEASIESVDYGSI
mmetsp:Transcript_12203/g.18724  ORF Transcript_12203/g.18724 Transcript_12203/m.18724 type:complete len:294 (-) Transcript_12203:36-917(-)